MAQQQMKWNSKMICKKEKGANKRDEKPRDEKYLNGGDWQWEKKRPNYNDKLGGRMVA